MAALSRLPCLLSVLLSLAKNADVQPGALTLVDTFTGRNFDVRGEARERIEPARWRGLA